MKYIDADELTTIIEERKAQQDQWINRYHDPINQGISYELTEILSVITSLQQEQSEVDEDFFFDEILKVYDDNNKYPPRSEEELTMLETVARHFYELGLNARKEEQK